MTLRLADIEHCSPIDNDVGDVEYGTVEKIRSKSLQEKSFLRSLRRGEEWLDKKMGIETQGIDRIKEEDKDRPLFSTSSSCGGRSLAMSATFRSIFWAPSLG